jgi:hypothetical protein
MLILRKTELHCIQIDEMQREITILRELLKEKNEFIGLQQNKINDLERQNRTLASKIDNMTERLAGSVISYA